jgi:hypothetical protein
MARPAAARQEPERRGPESRLWAAVAGRGQDARWPGHREQSATSWLDCLGREKAVGLEDFLIIAPYNAQVFDLKDRMPGARIGTVDKFQGQGAPIAIYFMSTSTHADAPRGMHCSPRLSCGH